MIGIIAACSKNGVIGITDIKGKPQLPFNYPEDLHHFKRVTENSTIIMGSKTFESIGKALPKRKNIVITSKNLVIKSVQTYDSVQAAVLKEFILIPHNHTNIWFIGGASIYRDAMEFAQEIHLTITPDIIKDQTSVYFPWINPLLFQIKEIKPLPINGGESDKLSYIIYERILK